MNERLVLGNIVGGGKMDLQCVFELIAFRRGEDDAGSQAGAHLGAVEMHPPMGGVGPGGRYRVSAQSTRKSVSACDLMAVRGW